MIDESAVWLILFSPIMSFAVIILVIRPFFNGYSVLSGHITIAAVGLSLMLSIWALGSTIGSGEATELLWDHNWMTIGSLDFNVGIILDPLTAIMLVVATGVSLMVQIYSTEYMKNDSGYSRYYAYMSLFTASMVGLVLARNIIQLFVFWELVGLCSYLLIGFWYQKPSAAAAAKKAFIVTRVGDFGFLLAILYIFVNRSSFGDLNVLDITDIHQAANVGLISATVAGWFAIGIFAGAVGKSAQFPLHTWLPDAMEGPTPVSALIHAATMVAAGVFLVARFFPVFEMSEIAMNTVAIVGGFTALFAASMALVMNDIKRVLAYSTVSQLGFMIMALGVGAKEAAIFHLFTHAFFKALLFLGAGSVSHAVGTFDMRYMGGLKRIMPSTYITFVIGSISLAGLFPLSGFWSKDEILASAWRSGDITSQLVFFLAIIAVFMTAFYIFRVIFLTFEGQFRGGSSADPEADTHGDQHHLKESPAAMVIPLVLLAVGAIFVGFLVNSPIGLGVVSAHWFTEFLGGHSEKFNFVLAVVSTIVAISGIGTAYLIYMSQRFGNQELPKPIVFIVGVLERKYYIDEVYENQLVRKGLYRWLAQGLDWIDKTIIDGFVNATGWTGRNVGGLLRQAQTGQLQAYGVFTSVGILVILGIYVFFQ
jgi:NADH-quinone oxidoreductase subunit L